MELYYQTIKYEHQGTTKIYGLKPQKYLTGKLLFTIFSAFNYKLTITPQSH